MQMWRTLTLRKSTKDLQKLEGQPKVDEVSPTEALLEPEISLAENLMENNSEPVSSSDNSPDNSSDDSCDDSSPSFTLSEIDWDFFNFFSAGR